jgi:Na+/phosphate symporter
MNDQYLGEKQTPSEEVERIDQRPHAPVVNTDPFADRVPVDANLINPAPMGGTVAAVGPISEPLADVTPGYGSPVQETPVVETVAVVAPANETIAHTAPVSTNVVSSTALLEREESDHFRARWNEIQGKFVDEPRTAVQQADTLVSEVVENITQMFAKNHSSLESQWNQGNDVSTEDLRKALQQYRSFFNRLVV